MKKRPLKAIALSLCIIMLAIIMLPVAGLAENRRSPLPIVYVLGRSEELVRADGTDIPPVDISSDYLTEQVKLLMPVFLKALLTDNWDEYNAGLCAACDPIFGDVRLDSNGEASNGSRPKWTWSRDTLWNPEKQGLKGFDIYDYCFVYDYRVSPCESADLLAAYIDDVRYVTGYDKVNIVGRCEGAAVVQAYFDAYGSDVTEACVLYCSAAKGIDAISTMFSGKVEINLDALDRYCQYKLDMDDNITEEFVKAAISIAKFDLGLKLDAKLITRIYDGIYTKILPDVILASYGTCPAFWGMVDNESYDAAMELVFGGREQEYAKLIEKIEKYRDVQLRSDDILKEAESKGTKIALIAKYGYQDLPLSEVTNNKIADGFSTLENTSYGAVCALQNETLSDKYIQQRVEQGLGDYISSDRQVDASQCLFPDSTWIVKGIEHTEFPGCINDMMLWFFRAHGDVTIHDNPDYPQFLVYGRADNTIAPMTEENDDTEFWTVKYFESLRIFLEKLAALLKHFFKSIIQ